MDFKDVDAYIYVSDMVDNGAELKDYKKFARVKAEQGREGQEVITQMKNGLVETKNVVNKLKNLLKIAFVFHKFIEIFGRKERIYVKTNNELSISDLWRCILLNEKCRSKWIYCAKYITFKFKKL